MTIHKVEANIKVFGLMIGDGFGIRIEKIVSFPVRYLMSEVGSGIPLCGQYTPKAGLPKRWRPPRSEAVQKQ